MEGGKGELADALCLKAEHCPGAGSTSAAHLAPVERGEAGAHCSSDAPSLEERIVDAENRIHFSLTRPSVH